MEATTPEVTGRRIATLMASAMAGPTFAVLVLPGPSRMAEVSGWLASWSPIVLIFSVAGFAMAIMPVAIAVHLGGRLGTRDRRWRNPLVWAGVGAALGATLVWGLIDTLMPVSTPWPGIATGIVVAVVARRFVAWTR